MLSALHCSEEWSGTVVGIASRTDEPAWAQACLQQLMLPDGRGGQLPMKRVFSVEEIHKGNKTGHFHNIAKVTLALYYLLSHFHTIAKAAHACQPPVSQSVITTLLPGNTWLIRRDLTLTNQGPAGISGPLQL